MVARTEKSVVNEIFDEVGGLEGVLPLGVLVGLFDQRRHVALELVGGHAVLGHPHHLLHSALCHKKREGKKEVHVKESLVG